MSALHAEFRRGRCGWWHVTVGGASFSRWGRRRAQREADRRINTIRRDRAIARADLYTYRPGFDDRMSARRGWRR